MAENHNSQGISMPIRGCYCQKVDQKFSKKKFVENFVNCMNGEYDDGCGIPYSVKGGMHYGQLSLRIVIAVL